MRKLTLISILIILLTQHIQAQLTSSPYSIMGVGLINDTKYGVNMAMGGTGIAFKSETYLNSQNPASYSAIDSLSALSEIGLFFQQISYESGNDKQTLNDANLSNLAMGFRINKFWAMSLGIKPYSSVGYTINTSNTVDGTLATNDIVFTGSGGINQYYVGNGFSITENLSIGANASFLMGSIDQTESGSIEEYDIYYTLHSTDYIKSFYYDFGLQYQINHNKWNYTIGAIYGNKKNLDLNRESSFVTDSDSVLLDSDEVNSYTIPQKWGLGIAATFNGSYTIGFDYERKNWLGTEYINEELTTRNSELFSLGFQYIPTRIRTKNRFKSFHYRFGVNYNKSYVKIDDVPLNSMAVSAGIGLPMRNDLSIINFGFEYGQNGTLTDGLIREDYWLVQLNLTLNNQWFVRAKYK